MRRQQRGCGAARGMQRLQGARMGRRCSRVHAGSAVSRGSVTAAAGSTGSTGRRQHSDRPERCSAKSRAAVLCRLACITDLARGRLWNTGDATVAAAACCEGGQGAAATAATAARNRPSRGRGVVTLVTGDVRTLPPRGGEPAAAPQHARSAGSVIVHARRLARAQGVKPAVAAASLTVRLVAIIAARGTSTPVDGRPVAVGPGAAAAAGAANARVRAVAAAAAVRCCCRRQYPHSSISCSRPEPVLPVRVPRTAGAVLPAGLSGGHHGRRQQSQRRLRAHARELLQQARTRGRRPWRRRSLFAATSNRSCCGSGRLRRGRWRGRAGV